MTIEDRHFRTDGKTIEPCCNKMYSSMEYEEIVADSPYDYCYFTRTVGRATRRDNICKYCPWCGAKLEYVEKLEASE